jgi:7-carboxy-7-deazaguanine synthase
MSFEVSEDGIFLSFQGEGTHIGERAVFLRLAKCNLRCTWCDTKYAQQPGRLVPIRTVLDKINEYDTSIVVITGGEPMLQYKLVNKLAAKLDKIVCIETNGTIAPDGITSPNIMFIVSPKLNNSGSNQGSPDIIKRISYCNLVCLKFVVKDTKDIDEAIEFYKQCEVYAPIVFQPEGSITDMQTLQELWSYLTTVEPNLNIRFLPQWHKYVWGNKGGV